MSQQCQKIVFNNNIQVLRWARAPLVVPTRANDLLIGLARVRARCDPFFFSRWIIMILKKKRTNRIESAPGVHDLFYHLWTIILVVCWWEGSLFFTRVPGLDLMNTKVWKWKMVHMPSNTLIHWSMVFPNSNNTCETRHFSIQPKTNQIREATAKISERLVFHDPRPRKVLLPPNWLPCCVF